MVTLIFNLLILLSPICFGANMDIGMFDIIFFRTGIVVLFMASLLDKPKREIPKNIKNMIFTLIGLCLFNIFTTTFAPVVMASTMNIFLGVIGFCITYIYYDDKKNIKNYILIAAALNLFLFILQRLTFDPVFDRGPWMNLPTGAMEDGGLMGNGPRMMTYFALALPFLSFFFIPIAVVLGIYTHQIIIFAPIVIMLFSKVKGLRAKIGFGIAVLIAMFLFKEKIIHSLTYRFDFFYKPVLTALFDRPLLGFGLGLKPIPEIEVVGSSYLQFIVGIGILGAVWFGYVFKSLYKMIKNNMESIALVSLAIIALIEYPLETTRDWYLIMGILTMFLIKSEVKNGIHA